MLKLPNNCRAGKMSVYPPNWKTVKAKVNCNWRITYWFYDDNLNKKKQVAIKGMNDIPDLKQKQAFTQELINDELDQLQGAGFNPITGTSIPPGPQFEISEYTPWFDALSFVLGRMSCVKRTKDEIRNHMKRLQKTAEELRMDRLPIGTIRRRQIKQLLEKASVSPNNYNTYRKYLSVLFRQLLEYECVDANILRDINKKPIVKRLRNTLTMEERQYIDQYLHQVDYPFWRLLQIFFHSGARETEIVRVKKRDVNLANQTFKVTVLKGQSSRETLKTIKNSALDLWRELVEQACDNDYIFSRGFKPGPVMIDPSQITKRWYRKIKKKCTIIQGKNTIADRVHIIDGNNVVITADFYSLKHSNTSEVVDMLSDQDAAAMNAHTSTAMVVGIYDVKRKSRQHERLKNVDNSFG